MKKVLLVSMPFGALNRQALGISLLKARLRALELPCELRYFNFDFAEFLGHERYHYLQNDLPHTAFVGEWLFSEALYGPNPARDAGYSEEVLQGLWGFEPSVTAQLLQTRTFIAPFLEHCLNALPWQDYALVGFTSTFEQNIASLALAKRLKAAYPDLQTVFGGANWEGAMGHALHKQFSFIDYVCSGEADESFPELVKRVLNRPNAQQLGEIKGIVYRHKGESRFTGPARLVRDMDALEPPDFSDYFDTLESSTLTASVVPNLLLETSRGCWWGAKSHCTFCGLNGGAMGFRSKSAERALEELLELVARWRITHVEVVDNILDMGYFKNFLPALAESGADLELFYEIKANLTKAQVRQLAEAGVRRVQPGIESLSDRVLSLMRKGTTALRNIQLLKWCKTYGVQVDWNILYGFPGETRADYDAMLRLLPAIRFLDPPGACGPIRLDRFSPYFEQPEAYGLHRVRPMPAYRYLYPQAGAALHDIAYYFDYDYAPASNPQGAAEEVIAYAQGWLARPEAGELRALHHPDGRLVLSDTRSDARQAQYVFGGLERAAYLYCDSLRSGPSLVKHLRASFPQLPIDETRVLAFLESLVSHQLMVTDGRYFLSLALMTDAPAHRPATPHAVASHAQA